MDNMHSFPKSIPCLVRNSIVIYQVRVMLECHKIGIRTNFKFKRSMPVSLEENLERKSLLNLNCQLNNDTYFWYTCGNMCI
jgi:hypothetical protein